MVFKNYPDIISKSIQFGKLMDRIVPDQIAADTYASNYLQHLLNNRKYYLDCYSEILCSVLQQMKKPASEISLADLGAGNGLLGIFARYCGFDAVLINEPDPYFLESAKNIAQALHIDGLSYYAGPAETIAHAYTNLQAPDAVVASDFIEHVYSLELLFQELKSLNPQMVSVFTTAANPQNPVQVWRMQKYQLHDEYKGSVENNVLSGRVPHPSFYQQRLLIVEQLAPKLKEKEKKWLANTTRGLWGDGIRQAVEDYKSRKIAPKPAKGYNTCNPQTGSWTERLLSFEDYRNLVSTCGFRARFSAGFYDTNPPGIGSLLKKLLNHGISLFGTRMAAFVTIVVVPAD